MPAVTPFPFTKLPPEIQLKVLRYAMPPHGILPRIPHEASDSVDQDEDWSPDDASAFVSNLLSPFLSKKKHADLVAL